MANDYWEKRYLKDKAEAVNRSEKYIAKQQRKYYAAAQKEIREDIEALYRKFADKENVTLAEAKHRINSADFSKIDFGKMTDYQIDRNREFRQKKENLPGDAVAAIEAQHVRYEAELRTYTKKGQITRLELLNLQIDKALLDLYDKNQVSMYDCLSKIYEDGYYRSIFAGQKAIGFGKDFTAPNTRAIERAVLTTYNKKGYSKRLYQHCSSFSKDLKENLITGFIKGESIDKMSARISRRLDVSAAHARRLVRTETAYVYEQASLKAYQECGIEKYEFLATLDHKTSPPCQELDGKRFYIKDAVPGKNYPPMHPNCRSTTVAAFDDDKVTARLAKDESEKYYKVPSDMTYKEWKEAYGDGGKKPGLQETVPDATIKTGMRAAADPAVPRSPILMLNEVVEQAKVFGSELSDHPELIEYGNGEPISAYVNRQLGYDALPVVVPEDEFKKISEGKRVLYRGITDYKGITAQDMAEQFKHGKFYCGRGVYGNGTYADYDRSVAEYYAYDSGDTGNGEIMEMLLADDVRTVSFVDIYTEYEKTGIPRIRYDKREAFQEVIGNVGVYATIKGYDAITLDGFQKKSHVIILNRGKVIIKG